MMVVNLYVDRSGILGRFGANPYGEPLFRLSYAPRMTRIVGGFWEDLGYSEYRRVAPDQREHWILEKWFPRKIFGDPRDWIRSADVEGYLTIGSYPYRGAYLEVFRFETMPDAGLLAFSCRMAIIAPIRKAADIKAGHLESMQQRQREWERGVDDMVSCVRAGTMQVGFSGANRDPDEERCWEIRRRLESDPRLTRPAPNTAFGQIMEGI